MWHSPPYSYVTVSDSCLDEPVPAMRERDGNRCTPQVQLYHYHDHYHCHHMDVMCLVGRANTKMAGQAAKLCEGILNNVKKILEIMIIKF